MRLPKCFSYLLAASIAAALASGCNGSQHPISLPGTTVLRAPESGPLAQLLGRAPSTSINGKVPLSPGRKRRKRLTAPTTVYVADQYNDEIIEYPAGVSNPAPKGSFSLPGMPMSVAEDSQGRLYVGLSNTEGVDIFSSSGHMIGQLNSNNGLDCVADGLTVDSDDNLYVSEGGSTPPPCGPIPPQVLEFASASDQPSYIYTVNSYWQPVVLGIASDAQDNLYVGGEPLPNVSKFPQQSQQYTIIQTLQSFAVAILLNNDLVVSGGGYYMTTYAPPAYKQVSQINYSPADVRRIATASDGTLYVPTYNAQGAAAVYVYPPAPVGPYTITQGLEQGNGLGLIGVAAGL
jgi:hypothetical protein